jgi:hypothetical protein
MMTQIYQHEKLSSAILFLYVYIYTYKLWQDLLLFTALSSSPTQPPWLFFYGAGPRAKTPHQLHSLNCGLSLIVLPIVVNIFKPSAASQPHDSAVARPSGQVLPPVPAIMD